MREFYNRMRALLDGGQGRPWYVVGAPWLPSDAMPYVVAGNEDPHVGAFVCDVGIVEEWDDENTNEKQAAQKQADAELIAAAVNALPKLLDVAAFALNMKCGGCGAHVGSQHFAVSCEICKPLRDALGKLT